MGGISRLAGSRPFIKRSGKLKFLIWSPAWQRSAGVQTLHRLTHLLNKAGFEAYISTNGINPAWIEPYKASSDSETIAIYPEIAMNMNPLNAPYYVGWMLNRPGALGGDRVYAPGTKVFPYHEKFRAATEKAIGENIPERRIFGLGLIDRSIFYDNGNRFRSVNGLWIYKGGAIRNLYKFDVDEKSLIQLDEMNLSLNDLADLLRRINVLYSYDPESQLNTMAQICGCRVIRMGDDGKPFDIIESPEEIDKFIADDDKDIDRVRHFANLILEDFQMKKRGNEFRVAIYTNECKKYCDRLFFTRLKELTEGSGADIHVVDNSIGTEYFEHLQRMILEIGFSVPVKIEHIDVSREDRKSLFQRNVSESLAVLRSAFLESDKDYFLILESDIIPKNDNLFEDFLDVIDRADIIGGIYYAGWHNAIAFLPDEVGFHTTNHVLSGCTVYKRRVIKSIPFRYSPEVLGAFPDCLMSHDAEAKGFRLADYWKIKCDHLGTPDGSRGQSGLR